MGGRGSEFSRSKGEQRGLKFSNGTGKPSKQLFPAYINKANGTGSLETITNSFSEKHSGSGIEYAIAVDENGYAQKYYKGNRGSVLFNQTELEGRHLVHNHTRGGWGNFSGTDLETAALSNSTGVTAVSRNILAPPGSGAQTIKAYEKRRAGVYQWKKTQHFKKNEFVSAIHNVKVNDSNYDKDLDKWLRSNQRKFGYKYSFTPARNKPE